MILVKSIKTNLTLKIIAGSIKLTNMQILFKSEVNRMKTDNFRNLACVEFSAEVVF